MAIFNEFDELHADDLAKYDEFGRSVDISGDIAVIGAPQDDNENGRDAGSAYIFGRDDNGTLHDVTDDIWMPVQKLTASDGRSKDLFGKNVAIDGDTIAIGAGLADGATRDTGAVYVFQPDATDTWSQVAKLQATDGAKDDWLANSNARSLDIYLNTIVVGAPNHDTSSPDSGTAYVFEDTSGDGKWSSYQETKLSGDAATGGNFGTSVSIAGNTIAVGAWGLSTTYVFEKESDGTWPPTPTSKLLCSDGCQLGWAVDVAETEDTIVSTTMSRTFMYVRPEAGWSSNQHEDTELFPIDDSDSGRFGWSVRIAGNSLVVGAVTDSQRAVHVFEGSGATWTPHARLQASDDAEGTLGTSVATDGDTILVGDQRDDAEPLGTEDAGSVYLFPRDPVPGITVSPTSGLVTTEGAGSDSFDVVLDTQPTADVTVGIDSTDMTEGLVDTTTLTFTTSNWDIPQTVTVTGVDDLDADGDVGYSVLTAAATSSDPDYNGLDAADVSLVNLDDDGTIDPNTLYVYDIRFESRRGGNDWRAVFEVQSDSNANGTADTDDNSLEGVSVEVTFNGQTFTGVTDSEGLFRTQWQQKLSSGKYWAEAVDLALTDYVWDKTLGEDDDDGDGNPDELLTI